MLYLSCRFGVDYAFIRFLEDFTYMKIAENKAISLRRSSISSAKVLFRVQVMKRKREKFTILKEVSLYLFVNTHVNISFAHA